MSLRRRIDRALGLGPTDEPRPVAVGTRGRRVQHALVSTPGARVRISRDGWDGEVQKALLWCVRSAVPVEIVEGDNGVWVDGEQVEPTALPSRVPR